MKNIIDKDKITFDELYALYKKQTRLLNVIIRRSDEQAKSLIELNKQLELMAYKDPMTQAYNRRYFFNVSKDIISLSRREKQPLSILMLDIDKFKTINDTYGHDVGDIVIKHLVDITSSIIRDSDIFARFGGEEFVLMLPNTDISNAKILAQKIRKKIQDSTVKDNIKFTVSIGVAQLREEDDLIDNVIKRADEALYSAKNNGRNMVQCIK